MKTTDFKTNLKYLDLGIIVLSVIISLLFYTQYPGNTLIKYLVTIIFAAIGTYYAIQLQKNAYPEPVLEAFPASSINAIVMLNESGDTIRKWDVQNKVALVIGKRANNNDVDIDLSESTYEALIYNEHAVINFASGTWYLEGLQQPAEISVKKNKDQARYRLNGQKPCKIEIGDMIYIANTRLLIK
ncbi:MAG: hypothetical protein LBR56_06285 [Sporomusaceae bacterium]|jgi:hypothetical protein|nr:hypothetical protein [Sporomusaceae bacterium]